MSVSKERETAVPAVTAATGAAASAGRCRPWWVAAASTAVLVVAAVRP